MLCDSDTWVELEFGTIDTGDVRLDHRAIAVAKSIANLPGHSLPEQMASDPESKALYRLMDNERISRENLEQSHWDATRGRAEEFKGKPVLFIQDTCTLSYNKRKGTTGLGPVGNSAKPGKGALTHNCLVFEPEAGVIGLAYQQEWTRANGTKPGTNTPDKESDVWEKTLEDIGAVPEGHCWVTVCDRGSDDFEFWSKAIDLHWQFACRVQHNRKVVSDSNEVTKAFDEIRKEPAQARYSVTIRNRKGAQQLLNMQVAARRMQIQPPANRSALAKKGPLELTLVRCWDARAKVEWLLVTSWPVETEKDLLQVVEFYSRRWLIEEYHKCLKSGMGVETTQFRTHARLARIIGLYSVLAVRLLQLAKAVKACPNCKATKFVDKTFVQALASARGMSASKMTLKEYWRGMAMMGGFRGRRSDGDPGWITLWRGFIQLRLLAQGFQLGVASK
jgi:hypothetical protein